MRERISFERIHELGAKRHADIWIMANAAAARWIEPPFRVDDVETKRLVSMIVLRVLDAVANPSTSAASRTESM